MEQCTADSGFNSAMVFGAGLLFSLVAFGIWQCYGKYAWQPKLVKFATKSGKGMRQRVIQWKSYLSKLGKRG